MAVKKLKDYVDLVQEKFPFLTKLEITDILTFGLRRYVSANRMNCDVKVSGVKREYVTQSGTYPKNPLLVFQKFVLKWRMKERYYFKYRKENWDYYYYVGVSEKQHNKLVKQKKYKTFENVYFTKLEKELRHDKRIKYIWRIPYAIDAGWRFFVKKYKTDKAEYIGENEYEKFHECFLGRFNDGYASSNNLQSSID